MTQTVTDNIASTSAVLDQMREAPDRGTAVRIFLDTLDRHSGQIERTRRCVEQVYRFQTPDRPVFQFDVKGPCGKTGRWVRNALDDALDGNMRRNIHQLESLPEAAFVPALEPGWGTADLIPGMFGADFDLTPEMAAIPKAYLVTDLRRDAPRLAVPDPSATEQGRAILNRMRFLVEETQGRLQVVYPQMQGPLANIVRMMPQEDVLMACADSPDDVRFLAERNWRVAVDFAKSMVKAIGSKDLLRPRLRGFQPNWVKGLVVDDYISVIRPEVFLDICGTSLAMMAEEIGPTFFHTCGPVLGAVDAMKRLPGVVGFETAFADRQSKTTLDLERVKVAAAGRLVLQSFELPDGRPVHDPENLTADWLRGISKGGGFMMQCSGDLKTCRDMMHRLQLDS